MWILFSCFSLAVQPSSLTDCLVFHDEREKRQRDVTPHEDLDQIYTLLTDGEGSCMNSSAVPVTEERKESFIL